VLVENDRAFEDPLRSCGPIFPPWSQGLRPEMSRPTPKGPSGLPAVLARLLCNGLGGGPSSFPRRADAAAPRRPRSPPRHVHEAAISAPIERAARQARRKGPQHDDVERRQQALILRPRHRL